MPAQLTTAPLTKPANMGLSRLPLFISLFINGAAQEIIIIIE